MGTSVIGKTAVLRACVSIITKIVAAGHALFFNANIAHGTEVTVITRRFIDGIETALDGITTIVRTWIPIIAVHLCR